MSSEHALPPPSLIVGRGLLVSQDVTVVGQLTNGMKQFAISTDVCPNLAIAIDLINIRKFEAIVVDIALGEQVFRVLERVRYSPSNQNSVTFALADARLRAECPIKPNFVMQKPLTDVSIASTLKAALGLIIRDYRRYFRYPLKTQVVIQNGSAQIPCEMTNISEGGLAVKTPVVLRTSTLVRARFTVPDEVTVFDIEAEICWCDNRGRAGVQFRSVPSEQQALLQGWLSRKIEQGLPESIARLFQKSR